MSEFKGVMAALLGRTPGVLRGLLVGLPQDWLATGDAPHGWRPRDVVGHLITSELDNWIPRIEWILQHGRRAPFHSIDRFAHAKRDVDISLEELVMRFARLRSESPIRLDELVDDQDLERRGLHPSLGEVTIRQLIAAWAVHDLDHGAQIMSGLAGSHDMDVGPWREFLGILVRRGTTDRQLQRP